MKRNCTCARVIGSIVVVAPMMLIGCRNEKPPAELKADSTSAAARAAIASGEHLRSRALLLETLVLDEQINRAPQLAEVTEQLGDNYFAAARFDSAAHFYRRAQDCLKGLGDRQQAAAMAAKQAAILNLKRDHRGAYAFLSELLRVEELMKDSAGIRELQWAMVPACRALDYTGEEQRILGELSNAYLARGETRYQARVQFEIGNGYLHRVDLNKALESFLGALTLADRSGDSMLAVQTLHRLVITFNKMGRTADALQMCADGLRRSENVTSARGRRDEFLIRMGNIHLQNRQFADAERFFGEALQSAVSQKNSLAEGYVLLQLGHCDLESTQGADSAVDKFRRALRLFEHANFARGRAYALFCVGIAGERERRLNDAAALFESALAQLDSAHWHPAADDVYLECEQIGMLAHQSSYYGAVIDILSQIGRNDEALSYAESKNRRRLFEQLNALALRTRDERLTRCLRQFREARSERMASEQQLVAALKRGASGSGVLPELMRVSAGAMNRMEVAADSVVQLNPAFASAVRIDGLETNSLSNDVPAGAAMLVWVPRKKGTSIFVFTSAKKTQVLSSADRDRLLAAACEYTVALKSRLTLIDSTGGLVSGLDKRTAELSSFLYSALIQPVIGGVRGYSRLILVLPEEWGALPVHTLRPLGSDRGVSVGEQFGVSYLPCASALTWPGVSSQSAAQIVGVGHPGGSGWDVEYELRDIKAFFKDARFHFKQEATLGTLERESGDVVHVAAEFIFHDLAPATATIRLSDGKADISFVSLSWGDLLALPGIPTYILSNLSEHLDAGYALLPSLFLMNGSPNVVLVNYPSTRKTKKLFGEKFYTSLLASNGTSAAYKKALGEIAGSPHFSAAHYWAPFFLWGK